MALFVNEAIDALQKIHDYGKEGTAKPSQAELDTLSKVASKQKISHLNYNQLLSVLNVSGKNVSSKQRLYGSYFYDLETYINNYKLDESRCDSCNSSCQSGQNCHQGGGGCGGSCEISCQTNCEGGICGCQIGCEGICALGAQCADCKALM